MKFLTWSFPCMFMDPLAVWHASRFLVMNSPRVKMEDSVEAHPALLTDVVLSVIFNNLSREDLKNCRLVCKIWSGRASVPFVKKSRICLFSSVVGDAREESEPDPYSRRCQSLNGFMEFLKKRDAGLGLRFDNFDLCLQEHGGAVKFLVVPEISGFITSLSVSVMGPCLLWLKPILPKLESLKVLDIHGGMENELIRKEFCSSMRENSLSISTAKVEVGCKIENLKIQSFARGIACECLRWILPMSPKLAGIEIEEVHWDGCECLDIIKDGYVGPGLRSLKLGGTMETTDNDLVASMQGDSLKKLLESCTRESLKELSLESWVRLPSSEWNRILIPSVMKTLQSMRFNAIVKARPSTNDLDVGSTHLQLLPADFDDADPRDFLSCFPSGPSGICAPKLKSLKMRLYYRILHSFPGDMGILEVGLGTSRTFPKLTDFQLLVEGVDLVKRHVLVNPIQYFRTAFPALESVSLSGTFIERINEILRNLPSSVQCVCLGSEFGSSMHLYDVKDSDFLENGAIYCLPELKVLKLQRRLRCQNLSDDVAMNGFLKLRNLSCLSLCGHKFTDPVVSALREKLQDLDLRATILF